MVSAQLPVSAELAGESQAGLRCNLERPSPGAREVVNFGVEERERLIIVVRAERAQGETSVVRDRLQHEGVNLSHEV
jgi:hypothetical protein